MKQKFYSESLDKYFDSEKECLEAEKEFINENDEQSLYGHPFYLIHIKDCCSSSL